MKNKLYIILLYVMSVMSLNSCIEDESVGANKVLSAITIEASADTMYAEYGFPVTCEPSVKQSQEGLALTYEWRASYVDPDKGKDSLLLLSDKPVLYYSFKKLGEYWLRLQVSNEHGSSFRYFTVMVRSAFDEGLVSLSADESGRGRLSFLRLKNEGEIIAPKDTFMSDAFATMNPSYSLNGPSDILKIGSTLCILSKTDQLMYYVDVKTFDVVNVYDLKKDIPGLKFTAIGSYDVEYPGSLLLHSENGDFYGMDKTLGFVYKDSRYFPEDNVYGRLYSPLYTLNDWGSVIDCYFFMDYDQSHIDVIYGNSFSSSGDYYTGQDIVNLVLTKNNQLRTISVSRKDPLSVNVSCLSSLDYQGAYGIFKTPQVYSYTATSPLTLDIHSRMVTSNLYKVAFYNRGNKVYRWEYTASDPELPEYPVITFDENPDEEVTCLEISPNMEFLYVGVYNPRASGLKGSIYVYNANTLQLVQSFKNKVDKPVRVFYKIK